MQLKDYLNYRRRIIALVVWRSTWGKTMESSWARILSKSLVVVVSQIDHYQRRADQAISVVCWSQISLAQHESNVWRCIEFGILAHWLIGFIRNQSIIMATNQPTSDDHSTITLSEWVSNGSKWIQPIEPINWYHSQQRPAFFLADLDRGSRACSVVVVFHSAPTSWFRPIIAARSPRCSATQQVTGWLVEQTVRACQPKSHPSTGFELLTSVLPGASGM